MDDRQTTRRLTPILLWRWELVDLPDGVSPVYVYPAVQSITDKDGKTRMESACRRTGMESVRDVDGTERCLSCMRSIVK